MRPSSCSGTRFPRIGELPYLLTLAGTRSTGSRWKRRRRATGEEQAAAYVPPPLSRRSAESLLARRRARRRSRRRWPAFLETRRWFRGRAFRLTLGAHRGGGRRWAACNPAIVRVEYAEGEAERSWCRWRPSRDGSAPSRRTRSSRTLRLPEADAALVDARRTASRRARCSTRSCARRARRSRWRDRGVAVPPSWRPPTGEPRHISAAARRGRDPLRRPLPAEAVPPPGGRASAPSWSWVAS